MQRLQWNNVGWVDYNLVLNSKGGPSYVNQVADAPVIMSENFESFTLTPRYYALGHLSKFILPDSVRVDLNLTEVPPNLYAVAFLRPDNLKVVSIFNRYVDEKFILLPG